MADTEKPSVKFSFHSQVALLVANFNKFSISESLVRKRTISFFSVYHVGWQKPSESAEKNTGLSGHELKFSH